MPSSVCITAGVVRLLIGAARLLIFLPSHYKPKHCKHSLSVAGSFTGFRLILAVADSLLV